MELHSGLLHVAATAVHKSDTAAKVSLLDTDMTRLNMLRHRQGMAVTHTGIDSMYHAHGGLTDSVISGAACEFELSLLIHDS